MLDASTVFRCARVCSTYWSDATHPHTLDATPLSRHATLPQVPRYGVHERSEHGGLERVQRTFRTGCVRCSRQLRLSLASFSSVMIDLHSSREAGSAQGPPSATERRECKSRVTLLLRDADSGQIDHMAAEPTHGPHHPCTSSSRLGARGTLLAIANVSLNGGSSTWEHVTTAGSFLRGGCRVFGWCRIVSDAVGLVAGAVGLGGVGSVSRAVGAVSL